LELHDILLFLAERYHIFANWQMTSLNRITPKAIGAAPIPLLAPVTIEAYWPVPFYRLFIMQEIAIVPNADRHPFPV